jgi:hypothetical protein
MALGLSACSAHTGVLSKSGPSHVNNVEVVLAKPMGSPVLAETLRTKTLNEAARFGANGNPKTLRVSIFQYHKKNAAMSFLVGDSNRISANVTIIDSTTQTEDGKLQFTSIDDPYVQGVIGAVVAAQTSDAEVEDKLTSKFAFDVLERVYGSKAAKIARKNPPAVVTPAGAAPPPATAPVPAAKGTPVAMATPMPSPVPRPATLSAQNVQKVH